MITFARPIWNSKTNTYVISLSAPNTFYIESESQYSDISSNQVVIEHPDTNNDTVKQSIKLIVDALIQKNNEVNWFATSLHEASILRRLEHKWKPNPMISPTGWFIAKWIPATLEVTPSSFILSWVVLTYEEASPRISSRFLSLSAPPSPRSVSPHSTEESVRQFTYAPGQTPFMEQIFDIPLSTNTAEIDLEEEKRERQSIREARLRMELAQMKLEKHLQNYYHKYGNIPDDIESELSESSLEES
jgi:hypothetical protein